MACPLRSTGITPLPRYYRASVIRASGDSVGDRVGASVICVGDLPGASLWYFARNTAGKRQKRGYLQRISANLGGNFTCLQ
jgi:hypothetical protein